MRIGLVLGDQLSMTLPTLKRLDQHNDHILMAEVYDEATYIKHHKQKIAMVFSAMRHFAEQLHQAGWQVIYHYYDPSCSENSLLDVLARVCDQGDYESIVVTQCGEYRLAELMYSTWPQVLQLPVDILQDDRFFCSTSEFKQWASGKKQLRLEYFYRDMRRKTGYLMVDNQPEGGQWNFDSDNRKRWPGDPPLPSAPVFQRDDVDDDVLHLVEANFAHHPGQLTSFHWATTRAQALSALQYFLEHGLPFFGDFQDAMVRGEYRLFHSLLSPYLNCGLLQASEVCDAVQSAFYSGKVPLNAAEGCIRQILGWREYVRGIYWLHMPEYREQNALNAQRRLPDFYWHGQTRMACMADCFHSTFEHAYAHHIQRLMVTGNFALLAGISPKEISDWYLAVYADAYEWVELPNTLGMVMHADGGYLGSKPYAASGNYINKMSDYCKHCEYNVKTQTEHDSCPFNSLYWHFIQQHSDRFRKNPRMTMVYRSFERMDIEKQNAILAHAEHLLDHIESL